MSLHQLASDLDQANFLSLSSVVRGEVSLCDPQSPFLCFYCTIPWGTLVIILTVMSQGHLQMCSISFQSHLAVLRPCPREGSVCRSFHGSVCVHWAAALHPELLIPPLLLCPKVVEGLCWGNHWFTGCQLREAFQSILCVCFVWTSKHFREAV